MKTAMLRLTIAALTAALVATAAQAQMGGGFGGGRRGGQQSADKGRPQKPKADEKAYHDALSAVPDKPYDPWHIAR